MTVLLPGETTSKELPLPQSLLKSVWCNSSVASERVIRVSYQDEHIIISCQDSPYLYFYNAGNIKLLSIRGEQNTKFKMARYEGPVADCKKRFGYGVKCLEPCQKPLRGSAECRGIKGDRDLQISYPRCAVRQCKIDRQRVKSSETSVPCGARRILGCQKGFMPEESRDHMCTESGWEPKLQCYNTSQVSQKYHIVLYTCSTCFVWF